MKLGRLLLRSVVGGYFVGHGTQKLFGWFDGYGAETPLAGSVLIATMITAIRKVHAAPEPEAEAAPSSPPSPAPAATDGASSAD